MYRTRGKSLQSDFSVRESKLSRKPPLYIELTCTSYNVVLKMKNAIYIILTISRIESANFVDVLLFSLTCRPRSTYHRCRRHRSYSIHRKRPRKQLDCIPHSKSIILRLVRFYLATEVKRVIASKSFLKLFFEFRFHNNVFIRINNCIVSLPSW
jgi:hypothetical protein